ncbi:MAG: class I SAM-dependent methyltransferase [Kiloniellaceae bacterium]
MIGRPQRRRLWFGLLTVLGLARRGYFIPYRYAGMLPRAGTRPPYSAIEALFATRESRFHEVLSWIDALADDLTRIEAPPPEGASAGAALPEGRTPPPRWGQSWFPRLDAALAYALLRRFEPRRVIEVGSGHSTRFLVRAGYDGGLATRITAIDPAPRADPGSQAVDLRRVTVQEAGTGAFAELAAGDFLLIDSSHILMPGSDVDFLLGRVLPTLPAGVLVQLHDIFLPDDYPAAWAWRGYNEQLGVLSLLLGGGWEVLFASHYAVTRMARALEASVIGRLPLPAGAIESSLWIKTR